MKKQNKIIKIDKNNMVKVSINITIRKLKCINLKQCD